MDHQKQDTSCCPTCRTKFNLINIVESYRQQQLILRQIDVLDKTAPKDDGVLDLSAIPDDDNVHEDEEDEGDENCVICASNERAHEQVVCDGCSRTFHVSCLGIAHLPFCDWFCPTCEIDSESMLFSTFSSQHHQQQHQATLPSRRRRRRHNMIPSLSTSPLPLGDGSSIRSTSPTVTESSTPKLSAEEMQAWEMLEVAQNVEDLDNEASSLPSTSSAAPASDTPKFKRPTRRFAATMTPSADETSSGSGSRNAGARTSQPTFMQSLLNDIRNTSSSSEISIEPPKRNPKTQLSLEKKEKVQALVRDALRPVYRSGSIDKDEYTRINKTVSRSLYGIVVNEKDRDFSKYKPVVESYVNLELQNSKS
ncbi:hypothetical protein TRICI_002898 [Trichomonascus ciferrii]|uniref:PHD-type domain-containing protein n=1 Tax=Trichomonascus ciferrii TaxID=44093 RepID=A0A642VAK0_9ASCO|nr:hypothetical protein TRICI_002898 [Trichomonascus ciferrii]